MLAKLKTFSPLGIDALPVEVDVSPAGLPKTLPVWNKLTQHRKLRKAIPTIVDDCRAMNCGGKAARSRRAARPRGDLA
jgi:hypothetical protein